jgi:hypothetical protein
MLYLCFCKHIFLQNANLINKIKEILRNFKENTELSFIGFLNIKDFGLASQQFLLHK